MVLEPGIAYRRVFLKDDSEEEEEPGKSGHAVDLTVDHPEETPVRVGETKKSAIRARLVSNLDSIRHDLDIFPVLEMTKVKKALEAPSPGEDNDEMWTPKPVTEF